MNRRTTLAVLLAVLVPPAAHPADLAEVKKRGKLRVLMVPSRDEVHFFSLEPGTPPGFDREVLDGFAALHGVQVEPVPVTGWDGLIPALLRGRGDVIAGGFTDTAARRRQASFTSEIFPTRNVVITRRPHRVVQTAAELREERVGTIRGTTMAEAIAAAGVPAARVDEGFRAGEFAAGLREGRITAAVDGVEAALRAKQADPELQLGLFLGPPESLAYAVRKEDRALLAALDEYVDTVRRSPTWSRLAVKYFGAAAPEILKKARGQP